MLKEPAVQTAASPGAFAARGDVRAAPVDRRRAASCPCVKSSNRMATLVKFAIAVAVLVSVVVAGAVAARRGKRDGLHAEESGAEPCSPVWNRLMGRDMLVRTVAGLSTSVLVGLLAAGVSSVIAGCSERRLPWEESASMPR